MVDTVDEDRRLGSERRRADREKIQREHERFIVVWIIMILLGLLCLLNLYGVFIDAPAEREDLSRRIDNAIIHSAQASQGSICNDHKIIDAFLPGARARDDESGTHLTKDLLEIERERPCPSEDN